VGLTKVSLSQIFLHFGQFYFYSRQVCNKRVANCTAITDTLTLNGFTRNAKHGFNFWKWSSLAWNSSSSRNYFSILPLCALQLPLREKHSFQFSHWENERMFLAICVFKNFKFSSGNLSSPTCDLDSLSLLSNRADSLVTRVPSKVRNCAEPPEYLRNEILFLLTCNIPNLISCIYRIALLKCFTGCVYMVVKLHAH